jgi:L-amino acid N-acyltransferase YncA
MIRLARPSDAEAMLEIYAPIVLETWISFELTPPSVEELRERIRLTLEHAPWLVYEQDGKVAGYAYAKQFWPRPAYQWAVEVTVYVHPQHQGHGVGQALYQSLFRLLRAQGYCKALAIIALPNPASIALHQKLGFTSVGVFHSVGYKLGGWRDTSWWELNIRELPPEPSPPKALSELTAEEWRFALRDHA